MKRRKFNIKQCKTREFSHKSRNVVSILLGNSFLELIKRVICCCTFNFAREIYESKTEILNVQTRSLLLQNICKPDKKINKNH